MPVGQLVQYCLAVCWNDRLLLLCFHPVQVSLPQCREPLASSFLGPQLVRIHYLKEVLAQRRPRFATIIEVDVDDLSDRPQLPVAHRRVLPQLSCRQSLIVPLIGHPRVFPW